jgi:erythronate-4-phosphate dehydrogenase
MRILADENIPLVREIFGTSFEIRTMAGRDIKRSSLDGFDTLLVRSVTKVDQTLLEGTSISFVGTATTGTDHIDKQWLQENRIAFADAAGSNAESVVNYIFAVLLRFAVEKSISLTGKRIGIIGVGRIGSRIAEIARAIGMEPLLNDPPREDSGELEDWVSLEDALEAHFITLHTPLEREGPYRTWHLIDAQKLELIPNKSLLINAARGPVVDNLALLEAQISGQPFSFALDTWENEPAIDPELCRRAFHASPHTAGYSYDGKIKGTLMLYKALNDHLGKGTDSIPVVKEDFFPLVMDNRNLSHEETLWKAISTTHPFLDEHRKMALLCECPTSQERGIRFDQMRKEYPKRLEFHHFKVSLSMPDLSLQKKLEALGFQIGH